MDIEKRISLIMFRELREWLHLLLLYRFLYICAFVVTSGVIVHAKKDNLQIQNYAPPSEPIQQIITTKRVLGNRISFPKGNEFRKFVNGEEE